MKVGAHTIYLKLVKLGDGKLASTVIRLMMACNDISLANTCLGKYKSDRGEKNNSINNGVCMYFVRLQIGHMEEGLKIIKQIRNNEIFTFMIQRLSQQGKKSFDELCDCIDGKNEWNKYFKKIRGNLSFHYNHKNNSKLILRALKERISKRRQEISKITVGDSQEMWFVLADEIHETIICRDFFDISYEIDLQKDQTRLNKIMDYGSEITKAFLIFGSEFILKIAEN